MPQFDKKRHMKSCGYWEKIVIIKEFHHKKVVIIKWVWKFNPGHGFKCNHHKQGHVVSYNHKSGHGSQSGSQYFGH